MSTFEIVRGVDGDCLVLDGTRICGPKPWGGGRIINTFRTDGIYEVIDKDECRKLKAENAKLREQVDAAHMSRLLTENENEELRELSARAWRLFTEHGAVHESDLPEVDAVRDKMRELGVVL